MVSKLQSRHILTIAFIITWYIKWSVTFLGKSLQDYSLLIQPVPFFTFSFPNSPSPHYLTKYRPLDQIYVILNYFVVVSTCDVISFFNLSLTRNNATDKIIFGGFLMVSVFPRAFKSSYNCNEKRYLVSHVEIAVHKKVDLNIVLMKISQLIFTMHKIRILTLVL